jgi:hypothetical protein
MKYLAKSFKKNLGFVFKRNGKTIETHPTTGSQV